MKHVPQGRIDQAKWRLWRSQEGCHKYKILARWSQSDWINSQGLIERETLFGSQNSIKNKGKKEERIILTIQLKKRSEDLNKLEAKFSQQQRSIEE